MERLAELLKTKGGVILAFDVCSPEAIEDAKANERFYEDRDGFGFVHFTTSELDAYGGGIKNPKKP